MTGHPQQPPDPREPYGPLEGASGPYGPPVSGGPEASQGPWPSRPQRGGANPWAGQQGSRWSRGRIIRLLIIVVIFFLISSGAMNGLMRAFLFRDGFGTRDGAPAVEAPAFEVVPEDQTWLEPGIGEWSPLVR